MWQYHFGIKAHQMFILLLGPYHIKIRDDLAPKMRLKPNTSFNHNKEFLARLTHVVGFVTKEIITTSIFSMTLNFVISI